MRKEYRIGILCYAITMLMNQFFKIPELLYGVGLGLSICFMLMTILPEKTYWRLKEYKKNLRKKITRS